MSMQPKTPDSCDFQRYLKPKVSEILRAVNLDKTYFCAEGNYLLYRDKSDQSKRVLDLVGAVSYTHLTLPTIYSV